MKPLASIAMGLVVVVLVARYDGYDALADPLGWLLVLWGVRRLADPTLLLGLAGAALVVACAVWLPSTQDALDRSDPSLWWAATLPQVIFCVLLCHRLAALAQGARDAKAAAWLRTTMVLNVVLAVTPVLAFASGSDDLLPAVYAAAVAVVLLLIVLLFAYANRPWVPAQAVSSG
ncbi:hypothetical protein [Nocardioides sp.]|uniref:hypothetical protein n=1 Tax=Nocardioides sp. TaxID=35761 RepID=UPI002BB2F4D4|nr:hypothetical protein [Nocardioides sp.]HXH81048.1 hypothetical protein [Nocardioides sp.]